MMTAGIKEASHSGADNQIEISVKGQWVKVPALAVSDGTIVVRGGMVRIAAVHDEEWMANEIQDPESVLRQVRNPKSSGLRADLFTFTQMLPDTEPRYPFPKEMESHAVIRLNTFKEWWEKLPQEGRKNVRRAEKRGVVMSVRGLDDEVIKAIMEINNENPIRQGRPFPHYGKSFEQVKRDYSAFLDRSDFICASVGEEIIGVMKIVYRGTTASILQMMTKTTHYDKRPANALICKAVELCDARKISFITYGYFGYGNKRASSILDFKLRNGFEEILMPRYFVPVTAWGKIAFKLNLHRGLLGILPHKTITFLVDTRARCYTLIYSMSRRSSTVERPNCNRQMGRPIPPAGSTPSSDNSQAS